MAAVLSFVLLTFLTVSLADHGCIPKAKISAVLGPILKKRTGLRITLSPDDLVNLTTLNNGCHYGIPQKRIQFASTLTSGTSTVLKAGEVVKFNLVTINEGNGYNPKTGEFTCPMTGSYFITWEFIKNQRAAAWLELNRNGKLLGYARAHSGNVHEAGGRNLLLKLQAGDRLSVKTHSTMTLYGTKYYTSFSGFYVSP